MNKIFFYIELLRCKNFPVYNIPVVRGSSFFVRTLLAMTLLVVLPGIGFAEPIFHFVSGPSQTLTVCENSAAYNMSSMLSVEDGAAGETLTWSLASGPVNGSAVVAYSAFSVVGNNTPAGLTYTPNANFNGTDAFNVMVTNGVQTITATVAVTVNATPNVTATGDTGLCNGTVYSVTFGGSTVAGSYYVWTNNNASIGIAAGGTDTTGAVTLTNAGTMADSGTIIVTPWAAGCPGTADTFNVVVYPTPMLTGSLTRPAICDYTVFSYGDTSLTAGTSFAWAMMPATGISASATSGTDSINEVLANANYMPVPVTFVYTLTASGCANTQNVVVTVNPAPQLSGVTDTAQCNNQVFSYQPASLTGDSSFTWVRSYVPGIDSLAGSGTGAINDLLVNSTNVNVTDTYTYTITAYGCSEIEMVTVLVHPTPTLSSATSSLAICSGESFSYMPESATGSAVAYSWIRDTTTGISPVVASGTGSIDEVLTTSLSYPQQVTYSYTLLAYGCTNTENVDLMVNPLPTAPEITTYVSNVCDNAEYQNFGALTLPPAGESYYWGATNASVLQGASGQFCTVNFNEPGTTTVLLTAVVDSTQCSSQSSISVNVGAGSADQPYVVYSAGEFVCLENNVTSYQWGYDNKVTLDSTILAGQINQNYANSNPDTVSFYYWVITGQNGCFMKSYYNGPRTTAIANVNDATELKVYPNPATSFVNIDIRTNGGGNMTVELANMLGQKISEVAAHNNQAMIDISNLAAGVYMVDCYREGVKIAGAKIIKN